MTITNMGIQDRVRAAGGKVLDHGLPGLSMEEIIATAREQLTCDLFLCSTNAITYDGTLVNVDGAGNRIGAMVFGPKKVIVVVSVDKICKDEAAALARIEKIAAPLNNKRMGTQNPCTKTGVCVNCQGNGRICRLYSIIRQKPVFTDFTIVIVGESCGY